jgi:zinc transport system permease protein
MEFMQRALIVAVLISIITPMIGNVIVLKRLSSIGDALSHSGLAGVTIGLCVGINPVLSAVIVSVVAAITIEYIRRGFPNYSELATAIVLSCGVGLAAVFSGFVKNAATLNSFMFGSIVAISNFELFTVAILSVVVIIVATVLYRELFYVTFDEEGAGLSGVPVKSVNLIFTILTAIVVSVASRTVGVLVISSLMVVPVACAMLVSKSYKQNIIFSVLFAFVFTVTGLMITAFYDIKPGGTIVLIGIAVLLVLLIVKRRR